ncbi:hypothetical protein GCM10009719_17480 [Nocardioides kribbensis]
MGHSDENDATETLGCIYCQRTITWPVAEVYPGACLHCGRWPGAYTARVIRSDKP